MFNNRQKGKKGEDIASEYLKKSGYKIIEKNYRYSKNSEIDIVAEYDNVLVFVEVKARKDLNHGHPFESITNTKIQRIKSAIADYLQKTNKKYKEFRFDGIAIIGFDTPEIEHLKNIGQY